MRKHTWLLVLPLFFACTIHDQYRDTIKPLPQLTLDQLEKREAVTDETGIDTCSEKLLRARSVERFRRPDGTPYFNVGVIELSDDGHVKDLDQETSVLNDLDATARESRGVTVVVFVHGWHHRAKVCDENLACFRRVLAGLADQTRTTSRPVYGIYLGWRGESAHHATWATFYNRKRTAHTIGQRGGEEVLLRLDERHRRYEKEYGDGSVTMVTVGHSFGGALVFSALDTIMEKELRGHHVVGMPASDRVKPIREGFGDLTILVNPAFEAERYRTFAEDLRSYGRYSDAQRPILLTVASEGDRAVRYAFPAGRALWSLFRPRVWRGIRQQVEGLGHYGPFVTHRLDFSGTPAQPTSEMVDDAEFARMKRRCGLERERNVRPKCNCTYTFFTPNPATSGEALIRTGEGDVTTPEGTVRLRIVDDRWDPHAPFIVAVAPRALIDNHNDIYNPNFVAFLLDYITAYAVRKAQE